MTTKKGLRFGITSASVVAGIVACTGGGSSGTVTDGGASSSSSSGSTSSSSGSSSGGSSGAVDASVPANPCGTDPVDVGRGKGQGVIRGIMRMPGPADDVQFYVDYGHRLSSGNVFATYASGNAGDRTPVGVFKNEYTFEFQGIPLEAEPRLIFVQAWKSDAVDAGPDAGDTGDWIGFCGGTTTSPAAPWAAVGIELSLSNPAKCDVDFGIGPPVCLKQWGESCNQDNECRRPNCICNDDSSTPGTGECSTEQCVGLDITCFGCSTKGGVKSVTPSGCLGF